MNKHGSKHVSEQDRAVATARHRIFEDTRHWLGMASARSSPFSCALTTAFTMILLRSTSGILSSGGVILLLRHLAQAKKPRPPTNQASPYYLALGSFGSSWSTSQPPAPTETHTPTHTHTHTFCFPPPPVPAPVFFQRKLLLTPYLAACHGQLEPQHPAPLSGLLTTAHRPVEDDGVGRDPRAFHGAQHLGKQGGKKTTTAEGTPEGSTGKSPKRRKEARSRRF